MKNQIETIPDERLRQIERSNQSMLIAYLKEDTIFDSQGIDEMLELAKTFARRELERRRFTDQRTPSITVDVEMDCRDIAS